jgi:hypothetical protein
VSAAALPPLDVHGQVPFEVGDDRGRDADDASARLRLRRPEHERPGRPLHVRGPNPDGARLQVEVGPHERGDLAPSHAGERGQEHELAG